MEMRDANPKEDKMDDTVTLIGDSIETGASGFSGCFFIGR